MNKVIVEGLFTEQSVSVRQAERQKSKSQKSQLEEMSGAVSRAFTGPRYQASSFYPHTFSNLNECSLYGSKRGSLAGRAHPGTEGEKMRSRALARPLPEPPHYVVQPFASGLCFFWRKPAERPPHLLLIQLSLIFCPLWLTLLKSLHVF